MLMGEYNHTIDTKGRMIIPAKIREQLGDLCIVTKGLDDCLAIYTQEAWKKISDALQSQSSTKASVRALKRFVFGSAAELEYDKQAVIVGAGDHVEIWSREKYDYYDDQVAESMEELVEGLEGIML